MVDMRTYDCLNAWHAHIGEVCSIQFSVDETTIYSMGSDGKVRFNDETTIYSMGSDGKVRFLPSLCLINNMNSRTRRNLLERERFFHGNP